MKAKVKQTPPHNHEQFRSLYDNSMLGLYRTTPDGKILLANPAMVKMLGYSTFEELTGKNLEKDVFEPSYNRSLFLRQIEMNGEVKGLESNWIKKDGKIVYFRESAKAILDSDGRTLYYDGTVEDITENKRAEAALHESEIKLNVILESTADGILAVDGMGKVIKTNKRFAQLWHIPQSVIDSNDDNTLLDFIFDQLVNPEAFISKVKKLYNSTDEDLDMVLFKDGRIFERYSAPFIIADAPPGRVWSFRDITWQKKTEIALLENERKYKELFDNAPVGYHELDIQGRVARINHTELNMFGCTEEEMIGQYVWKFVEDEEKSLQRVMEKLRGIRPPSIGAEIVYRRKDLTTFPASVEDLILRDVNNNIIGIRTTVQDITKRKKAEEEISMLAQTLRKINECVSVTDLENKFIFINQSFLRTYGYSENELIGKHVDMVRSQNNPSQLRDEIFSNTESGGWNGEVLNKRKDGSEFPIYLSTKIIYDKDGKTLGRVGIASDITERKRTEQEIQKLNEQLLKSNSEKDKFFSIIAHDLKSPFHGFLGLTKEIAESADNFSVQELTQLGSTMYSAADNLFRLLQNLLEWAQMQSGSAGILLKDILLADMIAKNVEAIKARSELKGISINNSSIDRVHAYADENMINSVLLNLLSNAVKFTCQNGVITIIAKEIENQMIEVSIKDTGVGMPKSIAEKLFILGEKTGRKGTDGELSTGLGLLLCKEFVEKNNGKIWVESQENMGSTFYFTIRSHK
jgi:PAS domain S-box-containing protein